MSVKPRLIFDTSAYNALADDGDCRVLIQALKDRFSVRLTALNVSEILANSDDGRRNQVLGVCRMFLADTRCLMPHHWIVERMAKSHYLANPFDWRAVDVQFRRETEFALFDASLAREEREHLRRHEGELFGHLDQLRKKFQELFASGTKRPRNYAEFLSILQAPGGAFWRLAERMYGRTTGFSAGEDAMRVFIAACPPFYAALLGIFVAYYDRCIRDLKTGPSLRAGRYDLFMSVYLPFCAQFISSDDKQVRAFRETALAGGLSAGVRSYAEWRASLDLAA